MRDSAEKTPSQRSARDLLDSLLHMLSCKAAVKAGQRLSPEEIESLAQRHLIDDAHHRPHGRPTALVLAAASSTASSDGWDRVLPRVPTRNRHDRDSSTSGKRHVCVSLGGPAIRRWSPSIRLWPGGARAVGVAGPAVAPADQGGPGRPPHAGRRHLPAGQSKGLRWSESSADGPAFHDRRRGGIRRSDEDIADSIRRYGRRNGSSASTTSTRRPATWRRFTPGCRSTIRRRQDRDDGEFAAGQRADAAVGSRCRSPRSVSAWGNSIPSRLLTGRYGQPFSYATFNKDGPWRAAR